MEKYGSIYMIKNKLNNKVYFGQTIHSLKERYHGGISNTHNVYLRRSIEKYGHENFEIIEDFDIAFSTEELDDLEAMYIKKYDATNPMKGYNAKEGGANGRPSNLARDKMSNTAKEQRRFVGSQNPGYGKPFIGKHHPMAGKHHTTEAIEKNRNSHVGKKASIETKEKMSRVRRAKAKCIICLNDNKVFPCTKEASVFYNIDVSGISKVCLGKRKHYKQLRFMFYEDYLKRSL